MAAVRGEPLAKWAMGFIMDCVNMFEAVDSEVQALSLFAPTTPVPPVNISVVLRAFQNALERARARRSALALPCD